MANDKWPHSIALPNKGGSFESYPIILYFVDGESFIFWVLFVRIIIRVEFLFETDGVFHMSR